jgi:hypothetical protein
MYAIRATITAMTALALLAASVAARAAEVPTSAEDVKVPIYFTLTALPRGFDGGSDLEIFPWGAREQNSHAERWESDFPMASGDATYVTNWDVAQSLVIEPPGVSPATSYQVIRRLTHLARVENADGAWQGTIIEMLYPGGGGIEYGWLAGEGAYEGLNIFVSFRNVANEPRVEEGVVWPGPLPQPPDAASLPG